MEKYLSRRLKINNLMIIVGLFFVQRSLASPPKIVFSICPTEINRVLQQWGSNQDWKMTPGEGGVYHYYASTSKIGVWTLIEPRNKNEITLQRIESTSITVLKFK